MEYTKQDIDVLARNAANRYPWDALCLMRGSSGDDTHRSAVTRDILNDLFHNQVVALNTLRGTRRRKTMASLTRELEARGLCWTDTLGDSSGITVSAGPSTYEVLYDRGICIKPLLDDPSVSLDRFERCTASEGDIADLLVFFSSLHARILEALSQRFLKAQKSLMVSDIELPFVERAARDFLEPRGIRYEVRHECDRIILSVQIFKEIWMENRVHADSVEEVIRFIPYFIARPDRIAQDGRGFKVTRRWQHR